MRVERASVSMSSAIISIGLPEFLDSSSAGRSVCTFVIFLSYRRITGSSRVVVPVSASSQK